MMLRIWAFYAVLAVLCASPAAAQVTITEDIRLDFGRWVITNNNSSHNITVNANGSYSHSPSLVMLQTPRAGEYDVAGLPDFANINNVTVTQSSPMSGPGGQTFAMNNFDVICPDPGFGGTTRLTLGARAVLSGNTAPYGNGLYTGNLLVTIHY